MTPSLAIDRPTPALDALPVGGQGVVAGLDVPGEEASLLRAMGIAEGQTVSLLRVGLGGDPLHVRLGSGGEFALARPLARAVRIERRG
jgi:ferrous iron transport protein A